MFSTSSVGRTRGPAGKGYVTTGVVTANVKVSVEGIEFRAKHIDDQFFVIGTDLGAERTGVDPRANVHIHQHEPLFTYSTISQEVKDKYRHPGQLAQFRPATWSSFTRMNTGVPKNIFDRVVATEEGKKAIHEVWREMFETSITFVGWSAEPYTFNELTQLDNGVASIVAGSFTTEHTGVKDIHPCKLVQARAPPVAAEFLQKYDEERYKHMGWSSGMAPGRYTALLEEFDASEGCTGIMTRAAMQFTDFLHAQSAPTSAALFFDPTLAALFFADDALENTSVKDTLTSAHDAVLSFCRMFPADMRLGVATALAGPGSAAWASLTTPPPYAERELYMKAIGAVGACLHAQASKIVGKSLSFTPPGGQLHLAV